MVSRSELLLISFCCLYGKTQKFTVLKILISMGRAILYKNLDIITVTYSCTITYNWSLIIGVYPFPQMYHIIMYPYVYVIGCLLVGISINHFCSIQIIMVYLFVSKTLANHWTDMVLLYNAPLKVNNYFERGITTLSRQNYPQKFVLRFFNN